MFVPLSIEISTNKCEILIHVGFVIPTLMNPRHKAFASISLAPLSLTYPYQSVHPFICLSHVTLDNIDDNMLRG